MEIQLFPPFHYIDVSVAARFRITKNRLLITSWGELYRYRTQKFGENLIDYSRYGLIGHNGEDYAVELNNHIYSSHSGIVTRIESDPSLGIGVEVWDPVNRFKTRYWHMKVGSVQVRLGDKVTPETLLGFVNNTGISFGNHLHFDFKLLDEGGKNIHQNNGYFGATDPTPYKVQLGPGRVTRKNLDQLYQLVFYRSPDTGANFHLGRNFNVVLTDMLASDEYRRLKANHHNATQG